MQSEENCESQRNVVIQVEDEESSKGGNSVMANVRGDKFVPHPSNKVKAQPQELPEENNEVNDKDNEKEHKGSESESDTSKDSSRSDKNNEKEHKDSESESESSKDSSRSDVKSEHNDDIEVEGQEETQKTVDITQDPENEIETEVHDEQVNQDTYNEIEEEIFSEYTEKSKADDDIGENVSDEEGRNTKKEQKEGNKKESVSSVDDLEEEHHQSNRKNNSLHNKRDVTKEIIDESEDLDIKTAEPWGTLV
jgi:hypothetical protein